MEGALSHDSHTKHATHDAAWDCNICFEGLRNPVATTCGHLFCWPCLYPWVRDASKSCPVCRSTLGEFHSNIIAVYNHQGVASEASSASLSADDSMFSEGNIPPRPGPHRISSVPSLASPHVEESVREDAAAAQRSLPPNYRNRRGTVFEGGHADGNPDRVSASSGEVTANAAGNVLPTRVPPRSSSQVEMQSFVGVMQDLHQDQTQYYRRDRRRELEIVQRINANRMRFSELRDETEGLRTELEARWRSALYRNDPTIREVVTTTGIMVPVGNYELQVPVARTRTQPGTSAILGRILGLRNMHSR